MAMERDAMARAGEADERWNTGSKREWRSPSVIRMTLTKHTENNTTGTFEPDGTTNKS